MGKMVTRLFDMVDSVSGSWHMQTATDTSQKNNREHRDEDTMEQNDNTVEMTNDPDYPTPYMDPADMNLTAEDPHPESETGMEKPAISDFRTAAEEFNAAFNTALYELDSSRKLLEERSARIDELNESIKTISNTLDEEISKRQRKEEEHSLETEQLNQQIHDRESEQDHLHQQVNNQENTLNTRAEEISRLSSHIEELTNTLELRTTESLQAQEEYVCERDKLTGKIDELQELLDRANTQLTIKQQDLEGRNNEIAEIREQISNLTAELESRITDNEQQKEAHIQETTSLNTRIQELNADLQARGELLDKADTELTIKQQDLEGRDNEIAEIRGQISNLTAELDSRITDNEQQKEAHIQETTSLNTRIQELNADLQARGELLDKADTELTIKQQDLEDRDKQITDTRGRISNLTAELESRITDNEQQQGAHTQEITSLNSKIQELNADLQARGELLKRESNELESKGKEIAWLNEHVNELKDEIDAQAESMRTQAESHESTHEGLNAHISSISDELASLQTTHSELGAHAENIENLNRALHESSMSENSLHKKVLTDKTSEIEQLRTMLEAAGESPEGLQDDAATENLQMTLDDVESRLKETTAQNEKLCERVKVADELETEVEQLRIALQGTCDTDSGNSADLQSQHGQIADLEQALEESRTETKQLRNTLSASEEKCAQLQSALSTDSSPDSSFTEGMSLVPQESQPVVEATDRNRFLSHLNNLIAVPGNAEVKQTVMFILLDNFIQVRDEIGIMNSEQVINGIAEIITSHCNTDDIMSRFGDCTFAILSSNESTEITQQKADIIRSTVEDHIFESAGQSVITTLSIGICSVRKNDTSAEEIMSRADLACEAVRSSGGNGVLVSSALADDIITQGTNDGHKEVVSRTLSENRINIYYQPISSLKDVAGSHFEVLTRVVDEDGNIILPGEFFAMAASSGQTVEIDRYIIENIMKMMAENPGQDMTLFIKLTRQSVADHELPIWIIRKIKEYRINPEQLVFELAESTLQSDIKNVSALTKALNSIGCKIAIEHYRMSTHTQHLQHIHADFLKIDSGLVESMGRKGDSLAKVTAIMEMARKNNYLTVAEGVESPASLAILWELGVNFAQGYFIQAPSGNRDYDFHDSMSDEESEDSNRASFRIE